MWFTSSNGFVIEEGVYVSFYLEFTGNTRRVDGLMS
jgi:hypothetical protein